jgi:hypothetical protein
MVEGASRLPVGGKVAGSVEAGLSPARSLACSGLADWRADGRSTEAAAGMKEEEFGSC